MMDEIMADVEPTEGVTPEGERVDLARFAAGSIFPVVRVEEKTIVMEAGDGTRFRVLREDVALRD